MILLLLFFVISSFSRWFPGALGEPKHVIKLACSQDSWSCLLIQHPLLLSNYFWYIHWERNCCTFITHFKSIWFQIRYTLWTKCISNGEIVTSVNSRVASKLVSWILKFPKTSDLLYFLKKSSHNNTKLSSTEFIFKCPLPKLNS